VDSPRAGFGLRLVGYVVDIVFYGLLAALAVGGGLTIMAAAVRDCLSRADDSTSGSVTCRSSEVNLPLLFLGIIVIALGIMGVLLIYCRSLGRTGQTFGRGIVGVHVVDAIDGTPIGFPRALGRTLFATVISTALCDLGYLWMLWDENQQTWHDKVARTVVVRN
jgi:uncharacterized RDD family membrane protein YckC